MRRGDVSAGQLTVRCQKVRTRLREKESCSVSDMVSLLCCGPKLAACGIVISVWGVIMLILLGVFFNVHSAVLIEDVPFTEEDIFEDPNPPAKMYRLYEQVSYNCFIAAAIYIVLGGFSFCQVRLNKRKEYMVR